MFRANYQATLLEYEKFWERKPLKRSILNLSYSDLKPGSAPYRDPASPEEKWLSEDYVYNAFKHTVRNSGYLAEGIPMQFTNFGPGCLSACIGGGFDLAPATIWFDKKTIITDWENPPEIEFDPQSAMWQHITRMQNKLASDPEIHFSITDLGGIMDILASLRGTESLLYDLYDYPEEVRNAAKRIKTLWFKAFDKQLETIRKTNQPYNNWMNIPSEKPWYPLQCDFCYMISPAQFAQFVLPELVDQAAYMERSIYHLDGIGELPHVDMLLDIPGLTGIQWVSGDGREPLWDEKWFGLYRKIQDKKKNIVLLDGLNENDMAGAERLIKSVDPTGVYISVHCSSREKAEDMLEKVTRWSE